MKLHVVALIATVSTLFFSSIASAANVTSLDPQTLVVALQSEGYRAVLSKGDNEDPVIDTASSGNNIRIMFTGCDNHSSCNTIEFVGLWDCSTSAVSECAKNVGTFNNDESPVKAILIEEGKSVATYMYDFYDEAGSSERLFIRKFELFSRGNGEFSDLFSKK